MGGDNPVTVQSMLNAPSSDYEACEKQISALVAAGCDVVRMAISSDADIECAKKLRSKFSFVPLVADIQFDYRLAVKSSDIGFDKIRINPGNIGGAQNVRAVVDACKANGTAIRIGVNGGSIDKSVSRVYGLGARALVASALNAISAVENCGFDKIVVSAKSSDVKVMIDAYRKLYEDCEYPLHIGVTEAGSEGIGTVKSAIGIGALLVDGIGDTVRVSLTGDPVNEVYAALDILKALKKRDYCEIVSCPTCSRCKYDMPALAKEIAEFVKGVDKKMKIAIMGCVVNGPGEAEDADLGIAGGGQKAVIFRKGKVLETLPFSEATAKFKELIGGMIANAR